MKKAMFLGLVLSVVSLGSVMANDAYAPLDGKPKKVVINVNMPPAGGCIEHFNPGGCPPPPPPVGACNCHKYHKYHKSGKCHHNVPAPRPGKKPNKGNNPHFNGKPNGAPVGVPYGGPGGPGGAPYGKPGGRK